MTTNNTPELNDAESAILNATMDQARRDAFHADIERRTRDLTKRVDDFTRYGPHAVHPFVIQIANSIIDLIGYSSDSSVDDYVNELDSVIDAPDYAEEYAVCGYDDKLFADPTSAEYRAYCTEVDSYFAIYNHLAADELELLKSVSDVWAHIDADHDLDAVLREWFDRVMTFAETKKSNMQ